MDAAPPPPPRLRPAPSPPSPPSAAPPLSFTRWFARRACAADFVLLTLETLMAINAPRTARLLMRGLLSRVTLAGGGDEPYAEAARQDALPRHMDRDPSTSHLDVVRAAFPCAAGFSHLLLFTRATGAVTDPWVKVRAREGGDLAQVAGRALALEARRLYECVRHWPLVMQGVAAILLLSWYGAAVAAHDGLVPQLLARLQLLFGPLLRVLAVAIAPAEDRRLQLPQPGASEPAYLGAAQAALTFVIMAVLLPYVVVRHWKRSSLRRQHDAYLRGGVSIDGSSGSGTWSSCIGSTQGETFNPTGILAAANAAANAAAADIAVTCVASAARVAAPTSISAAPAPAVAAIHRRKPPRTLDLSALFSSGAGGGTVTSGIGPLPAAGAAAATAAVPVMTSGSAAALARLRLPAVPMYGSDGGGRGCRTRLLSFKISTPPRSPGGDARGRDFEAAAARVAAAAAVSLRTHNAIAAAAATAAAAAAGAAAPTPSGAAGRACQLKSHSVVCVKGCVHLLMLVHRCRLDGDGSGCAESSVSGGLAGPRGGSAVHIHHCHLRLDPDAASGSASGGRDGDGDGDGAVSSVLMRLMTAAAAATDGEEGRHGSEGDADADLGDASAEDPPRNLLCTSSAAAAYVAGATLAAPFLWPPALPLVAAATPPPPPSQCQSHIGGGGGGIGRGVRDLDEGGPAVVGFVQPPLSANVLVLAAALRGLRAVRCVVAGPTGRPRRQQGNAVVLDVTLDLPVGSGAPAAGAGAGSAAAHGGVGDDGAGAVAIRLALPPSCLAAPGGLALHLLPPASQGPNARCRAPAVATGDGGPHRGGDEAGNGNGDDDAAAAAAAVDGGNAPLATLPLLVLPLDAALEMQQLARGARRRQPA